MPRSIWRGAISFGLVHIPVILSSAENRNSFDLTMLDRRDMTPVGFKRYNKETEKEVEWDDIVKGYEYEKERYVVLTEEDFKRANVEATQTIDIMSFVDAEEIAPTYFETPYYLAPDKRGETDPRYFTTYYAIDAINFQPKDVSSALDRLEAPYLPLMVQEAAGLPLDPSFAEQKKILERCHGLFFQCAGGAEARRFNRLLIDAGLIKGMVSR